jgi:hypothetical protein
LFIAYKFFGKPSYAGTISRTGNIANIEEHIDNLMKSTNETAFVRICIHGTGDYIQFTGSTGGVQLDMPIISPRQKNLELDFRQACMDLNLKYYETIGSDGSLFLDTDINKNAFETSDIVKKFMGKLFNVTSNTKLVFEYAV